MGYDPKLSEHFFSFRESVNYKAEIACGCMFDRSENVFALLHFSLLWLSTVLLDSTYSFTNESPGQSNPCKSFHLNQSIVALAAFRYTHLLINAEQLFCPRYVANTVKVKRLLVLFQGTVRPGSRSDLPRTVVVHLQHTPANHSKAKSRWSNYRETNQQTSRSQI